jgi:hypothetical protein
VRSFGVREETTGTATMTRIAILVHEYDTWFDEPSTAITRWREVWAETGHSVVVVRGTREHVDADVVVNHVDTTITPRAYRRCMQRFPVGINRELVDISKRAVSTKLVRPGDGYEGPVMVKTNANAGGGRDLALGARASVAGRVAWKRARARQRDLARAHHLPVSAYPVFSSTAQVPAGVWRNRHLVVERLVSERAGDDYITRTWWFCGSRGLNTALRATAPVAKGPVVVERRELPDPVPALVHETRARLHADLGRIDYAVVDGQAVVYDVSRTPVMHPDAVATHGDELRALAHGIDDLLP